MTAAAALIISGALVGAARLLVVWLRTSLLTGLDQTALERAQVIAAGVDTDSLARVLPASGSGDTAVQVVDARRAVRSSSASPEGRPALFTFRPSSSGTAHTVRGLPLSEDGTWRAVALEAGHDDPLTVYVAVPTAAVDQNLAQLTVGLAITVPPAVALLTGVCWLFTGRALRPVQALRAQTAEITACDLGGRLDPPPRTSWAGSRGPSTTCWPGWTSPPGGNGSSSRTPRTSCAPR
ncbi:hypothetical protein N8I84_37575 [Streptomyces cynarae]|uniref:Uncharacterized protein n=1 Tax=Streptomyces cynarae TaxID=2981134 RepID=A0ABY6EAU2_9ACTN|nr:hypothetical protein [Streptomyces cynarae]UXY23772.1 hypothetical protein N8I84_37575 [Streptomyces cynarae]